MSRVVHFVTQLDTHRDHRPDKAYITIPNKEN